MTAKHNQTILFFCLALILIGGFLLRIWHIGGLPAILNRDEAALAYNALLLKETGRDEWNRVWPMNLQSFGDDKLIGYAVILIPFFQFFGYQDAVVRLPSVIAGTLLILVAYFFILKLFKFQRPVGVVGALLIAVEPVFFFYSRIAFEANVALMLFSTAALLLYLSTAAKKKIVLTTNFAALLLLLVAVFTYNTPLLLLPFLFLPLPFWHGLKNWKKWLPICMGGFLIFVVGAMSLLSLSKQKSGITIFSDESVWRQSVLYHEQFHGLSQKLLGNRFVFFGQIIFSNYVKTFSPDFMVINGGFHPWHKLPGFGHFGWTVYFLGIVGIIVSLFFWRQKKNTIHRILLFWLLISPLPSVITVDSPHATRSLFFFFIWSLFAVIGFQKICEMITNVKLRVGITALLLALILGEASHYFGVYFQSYPHESQEILRGGYQNVIRGVDQKATGPVAVVDDGGYQYILTAWYLKMSPAVFFDTINRHLPDKIGLSYGYKVGKYRFIKAEADHFPSERTIVWWNEAQQQWAVKE